MSLRESTRRDFLTGAAVVPDRARTDDENALATDLPPDRVLTSLAKSAMGCQFEFFVDPRQFPRGPEYLQDALELVEQLESELTVYRETSHLCAVNRAAVHGWTPVSPSLCDILAMALEIFRETQGAFDVTTGPLSKAWGFYQRTPRVPTATEIESARGSVGSQFVQLDREKREVRYLRPSVEINLASIGKGYALDRGREFLLDREIREFVLHGGQSSVIVEGGQDPTHPERGWPIGLAHPIFSDRRLGLVHLSGRALATSGNQRQWLIHAGRRLGHVLDPRSGWPTTHTLSATVLAPTAAQADALSTAFSVMNLEEIDRYCGQHPEISAIICSSNEQAETQPGVHLYNWSDDLWSPEVSAGLLPLQSSPRQPEPQQ